MKSSELLYDLGEYTATNQDLLNWSQANFAKDHSTYIGVDFEEPPNEDRYPVVMIFDTNKEYSNGMEVFTVEFALGLIKEELVKPDGSINNLFSYTGFMLNQDFRELVELVILKSARELHAKISVEGKNIPDMFYPNFASSITAKIEIIKGYRKPY